MAKDILQMLEEGVVLSDGGMIIEARRRGYSTPEIVAEHPDALRQIHADFFQAGSQVLQALTWWTSGFQLEFGFGWGDRLNDINRTAVECAREASGGEAPVAGCLMSTTARVPTSEGELISTPVFVPDDPSSHDRAKAVFDEHIAALVGAGVDLLIPETFPSLAEARLCLACCKKTGVPTMVLMGTGAMDGTYDGVSHPEAARILVDEGADIVGLVCNADPPTMWPKVLGIRQAVDVPIAFQPKGYRTGHNWSKVEEVAEVTGSEMAEYALKARAEGINLVGACCGAGPSHIQAMARALRGEEVAPWSESKIGVG